MDQQDESAQQRSLEHEIDQISPTRTISIRPTTNQSSTPSPGDPMDVTTPTAAAMGPPSRVSPDTDANGIHDLGGLSDPSGMSGPNAAAAAQAGGQQPKVVQTAFIHKLYK